MHFDYIIVGAGSSGCVLANRLSENPNTSVLLLEAGNTDRNPWLHIPIGYFKTMHNPKFDWCYKTEPSANFNRSIEWPRGKVMGGSSALNGLLYVRGQAEDYDNWAALGNAGWSYKEVLPYFKKSENNSRGADFYHGDNGELSVSNIRIHREVCESFLDATTQAGIPRNNDFNGAQQEGAGYFQLTISEKGLRCSSATAFIKPIKHRKNLTIITGAHAKNIIFGDPNNNKRATGVSYNNRSNSNTAHANKEVILSSGAIGSPQLLMVSGIGDAAELTKNNIDSISHLAGVGKNLQDHLQIRCIYKINRPISLNDELKSPLRKVAMAIEYALKQTGPLTMAASQVAVFTKTSKELLKPDIQFHFQPLSADKPADGTHHFSAFTASVCQLRPSSRGCLELQTNDTSDPIKIHPNYLATELDQKTAIAAIRKTREIITAPALNSLVSEEHEPGIEYQDDAALLDYARNRATTIYHPVGTCKMGNKPDPMSVVDERLKVHGVQNLRVVDCSIMPQITSGNTHAPAVMIAEKAADMIKKDNGHV